MWQFVDDMQRLFFDGRERSVCTVNSWRQTNENLCTDILPEEGGRDPARACGSKRRALRFKAANCTQAFKLASKIAP